MADKKQEKHRDTNLSPDHPDVRPADQAEGERGDRESVTVKRTPGQAEGDRETVEEDIRNKEQKGDL